MFTVEITYKSGKIEVTDIAINEYTKALVDLTDERRLVGIKILGVK